MGIARIKLNGWESSLIEEEARKVDFVCWLRNQARASWALCLPYEMNGEKKSFYPDFLIIRSDPTLDYIVDILEPHGNQYIDNLPKAKALAKYAKKEDRIGRIQLIHKSTDAGGANRFIRLDLTDIAVREKVLGAVTNEELERRKNHSLEHRAAGSAGAVLCSDLCTRWEFSEKGEYTGSNHGSSRPTQR